MVRRNVFAFIIIVAASLGAVRMATADTYPVILIGKVMMDDGSPPPFIVSIERVCSDGMGDAPGPLTDKKGGWVWRIEIDAFASRTCVFRASHPGYVSSSIDASHLNIASHDTKLTMPTIVLSGATADPYAIHVSGDNLPGRAKGPFLKAMKDLDTHNSAEAIRQLELAVAGAPKFGEGWHALGIVEDKEHKTAEARDAYTHAIEVEPKLLPPYVTLARLCIRTKDWQCALQTADSLIRVDVKRFYPEIYLHKAVAQYELKDLAGAEESAQEAIRLDPKRRTPREEYVLGRILEAKGDTDAAREHISKYLELQPAAPDAELVQGHMLALGKPGAPEVEPVLEPL